MSLRSLRREAERRAVARVLHARVSTPFTFERVEVKPKARGEAPPRFAPLVTVRVRARHRLDERGMYAAVLRLRLLEARLEREAREEREVLEESRALQEVLGNFSFGGSRSASTTTIEPALDAYDPSDEVTEEFEGSPDPDAPTVSIDEPEGEGEMVPEGEQ